MTVRELARQLGVSASHVSQLENGRSQPSVAMLDSLAQLLGVSVDRLFDEQNYVAPPAADTSVTNSQVGARLDRPARARETTPEKPRPSAGVSWTLPALPGVNARNQARLSVTAPDHRTRLVMEGGVVWTAGTQDRPARLHGGHLSPGK
jgi:transcriptional regulator with XRE-family HTH domain